MKSTPFSVQTDILNIREYQSGDEPALYAVYHSAIHEIACRDYTSEQIQAWAPVSPDVEVWANRMRQIRPFVVENAGGEILAYADVQRNGYIDHFFVSGACARRGVGTLLMNRLHDMAREQGIDVLTSDVSRTAQPFFRRFGFLVVEERAPVVRGVVVPNAFMRKELS